MINIAARTPPGVTIPTLSRKTAHKEIINMFEKNITNL